MAECYTNVHSALQTLMRSGQTVASLPAFIAGANGPAPLFMYRVWRKKRRPNLPALAQRMLHEKTGDFLRTLADSAVTPVQQSFALGFIIYYATSCTLNPYLAAMSAKGAVYGGKDGRAALAAALDSELYYRIYNTRLVPAVAASPALITQALAQVATLLRQCILAVYEKDVSLLVLADAYHHNLFVRRIMASRSFLKRFTLRFMPLGGQQPEGALEARLQPGKRLRTLPKNWNNPYTGEAMDLTLNEVLTLAEQTAAVCVAAALRYWLGDLDAEKLAEVLGGNDYTTGMPCTVPLSSSLNSPVKVVEKEAS